MRISQIKCSTLQYPLPSPLQPSWAPGRSFTHTTCTLVEVHTSEGIVGYGAAPDTGEIGLQTIAKFVVPYILGEYVFATERISPILRNAARDGSYPWAVETAVWDVIGKACQQPVYRLWGGYRNHLPAYASLAEIPDKSEQVDRIQQLLEQGFRAVKLRLRRPDIHADIELVETVRDAFGSELSIMVDANQSHVMPSPGPHRFWTYHDALTVARAMEELGVLWLEEPLPRYNLHQLAQLTAKVDLPIAGGELNLGLHEYKQLIDQDCYDIIQADAAFSEGVFQLRKVAALAEMAFKKFIPHTWSNGIGLAANLHLAASVPNCPWFEFPIDPPAWTIEARDFMLNSPFNIDTSGNIAVSEQPGFGIELDWDAIRKHTDIRWQSDTTR